MLTSREIKEKWIGIANTKASLPAGQCLILAVLAGLYIALGGLGATLIQSTAGAGLGKLLGACVFPAGLILVVMAGGELFTGNCLMTGPVLQGRTRWGGVLRNWGLAYLGNMIGAFLVSVLAVIGGVLAAGGENALTLAQSIAKNKCALSFGEALLRGVGCNVLVCGAVWMAAGASNAGGKAVLCFFPVMLFVLCGLEHSVANMYYVPVGLMLGTEGVSLSAYLLKNLLPVTLGNILGGGGLAAAYFAAYGHDR